MKRLSAIMQTNTEFNVSNCDSNISQKKDDIFTIVDCTKIIINKKCCRFCNEYYDYLNKPKIKALDKRSLT